MCMGVSYGLLQCSCYIERGRYDLFDCAETVQCMSSAGSVWYVEFNAVKFYCC